MNDSFFSIMSDVRRCSYPACGGWVLQRLNKSTTLCHDGRWAETCYTPVLDFSQSSLPARQQAALIDKCREYAGARGVYAIVRGRFLPTNSTTPRPELGRFAITEASLAVGETVATGAFFNVKDNGVRCFAAPCPSITETALNSRTSDDITEVDFTPADLPEGKVEACREEMATPTGLIIAGDRYTVDIGGRTGYARTVSAAFYPLEP